MNKKTRYWLIMPFTIICIILIFLALFKIGYGNPYFYGVYIISMLIVLFNSFLMLRSDYVNNKKTNEKYEKFNYKNNK